MDSDLFYHKSDIQDVGFLVFLVGFHKESGD